MTIGKRDRAEEQGARRVPVAEGSEAFLEVLNANNVDYIFLNPGTDTFPVQEAITKLRSLGRRTPEAVLCLHEPVAMAAAHAFYSVTGKPQVVMVHVDAGTLNVGGALHNAQRDRAAIVFCAGRAPYTFEGEMRGSRDGWIHWIQEQMDQHGIVRNYVKWDYEIRRQENMHHALQRAFQVCATEPAGPVYVTLPREILMGPMDGVTVLPVERYGPGVPPQGDAAELEKAVRWLAESDRPLILADGAGRKPEAVAALVRLAEALAIPVVESRQRVNFPASHPLHLGYAPGSLLDRADCVLIIDHTTPYIPLLQRPRPEARIVHLDVDPVREKVPLWGYPVDLPIIGDPAKSLPVMADLAEGLLTSQLRSRVEERRKRLAGEHREQRSRWRETALGYADRRPIRQEWLAYCINEVIGDDAIYVEEAVTNAQVLCQYIETTKPGSYFQSGGSSLGWGLGAGLGAKLAAPEKTVVSLVGDGSFVFGSPIAALWAAELCKAPFLTIILNNTCYWATKRPLIAAYPEGYSVRADKFVGVDLAPPPSYELVARSCRAYGETVTEPGEVQPALRRALEQVKGGVAAVLDVILEHP